MTTPKAMAGSNRRQVTYPPLDVLKPVDRRLWIVDSGPVRALGMPMPTRMTVIQLANGNVLLHSPTRFDPELAAAIAGIGPIRHILAPSFAHWMFVMDWRRRFPDAKVWGAPGLEARRAARHGGLVVDAVMDEGQHPWDDDIALVTLRGGLGYSEVALHHAPTRTLVLTDLVVNLEPGKLPLAMRPLMWLAGTTAPHGRAPAYLRWLIGLRRARAREAALRMLRFEPTRVIFSHGTWFAGDATPALRRSLRWLVGARG